MFTQKTRHEKNKVESHYFEYISKSHNDYVNNPQQIKIKGNNKEKSRNQWNGEHIYNKEN